jgi:hypothetical protein
MVLHAHICTYILNSSKWFYTYLTTHTEHKIKYLIESDLYPTRVGIKIVVHGL